MADHVNKQIRDAMIARLTGLPTTSTRVHSYRVNPLDSVTELPALLVHTAQDSAEENFLGEREYTRTVEMHVSAYATANADLDDVLDGIRTEVDKALAADLMVAGHALPVVYDGSEINLTEAERPAGELRLRYRVAVRHTAAAPDVVLDNFR